MPSLHAVVVDAVRIAVAAVDEGQQRGPGQKAALRVARAATHRVTHGRTKTRRDRGITIGNEGTTERWARQEGPVAS
jgi:hypothetical protein